MRRLIIGLLIVAWVLLSSGAQAQSGLVAQQEREVTYSGVGGVTLAGTLLLPRHRQDELLPGVIIVVGSGPVDRNGNAGPQLTSNLYHQIADQLASAGIASLRYDKRGVGASEPPPIDDSEPMTNQVALVAFMAWDNYVGDAAATLDYLQRQPEIDPTRTAMLGHSEGGYFVLQAAVTGKGFRAPPAALVLLAAPSRPYDEMIHDQLVTQLRDQGASAAQASTLLNQNAAIVSAIKASGAVPDNVPQPLAGVYPPYVGKFYQGGFKVNPRQLAAQFPGAVLVMQGAQDSEVSATIDAPALDAALTSRKHDDHKTVIVANASHNLKPVTSDNDPGYAGEIVPRAADELRSWLGQKLSSAAAAPTTSLITPPPTPLQPTLAPPSATFSSPSSPAGATSPPASQPTPTATPLAATPSNPDGLLIAALLILLLGIVAAGGWLWRHRRSDGSARGNRD